MKGIYKKIAAIAAGAVILALSVYTIVLDNHRTLLQNKVTGLYQGAFEALVTDMESLKTKLNKLEAANGTNQYSVLLMDVWRQAGDTESSIAALPVSYQSTYPLTQFMNRTGDYCRYLSTKLANGQQLSSDDLAQAQSLALTCGDVSAKINELWQQGYASGLGLSDIDFISADADGSGLDFTNQEFPRLVYDGPFSESTENKQPQGLGSNAVSKEDAQAKAGQIVGVDPGALSYMGDLNGTIASYGFSGQQNNIPFTVYISKQGGRLLWYMSQRDTGITASPTDQRYEQLKGIAQAYLRGMGYGETAASYAQFYGGMAVINLAPVENGAVLYPDLIKVWVDISADDVAGVDANNYLMSHKQRDIPAPALTKDDAQAKINGAIAVTNARLALIPLDTNEEKLCWEFTGTVGANEYLVYINAETGAEEDILMIQDTNEGKLVM
jgi:spore germination protein